MPPNESETCTMIVVFFVSDGSIVVKEFWKIKSVNGNINVSIIRKNLYDNGRFESTAPKTWI
jgi:hypothetical protein